MQLRLGSPELEAEISSTALGIIQRIDKGLKNKGVSENDIQELVEEYIALYRDININRNEAFNSLICRLG